MIKTMDIEWPTTLPLPFVNFSGAPRNTTLFSSSDSSRTLRRSRSTKGYDSISVQWVIGYPKLRAFEIFYKTTLAQGNAAFKIELRFPLVSALTEWAVRFRGGYEASHTDGIWTVNAELELLSRISLGDDALIAGALYLVQPEDTGGEEVPYLTADGFLYYVKE